MDVKIEIDNEMKSKGTFIIKVGGLLSTGAIVGIVLGCLAGVALIIAAIFIWKRKKRVYQSI
jgi:uncharacterized membrane protein YbaN (DUF454 family)